MGEVTIGVTVILAEEKMAPKQPIFYSILPIALQKIAHVKIIEIFEILGGMPDQIKKKHFFNER